MAIDLKIPAKYRQDIEKAAKFLKNEGCGAVFLFGSLVTGDFRDNSDIDIGIREYPIGTFFKLYSRLYLDFDTKIDLVDFDTNNDLYDMLNELGEIVQIG